MLAPALVFYGLAVSDPSGGSVVGIVGNLGIPVPDFAFDEVGRRTAVLWTSVQSVLLYTLDVYVASRFDGAGGLASVEEAFRIPLVYAVAAALLGRRPGAVPPADSAGVEAPGQVGDAAVPITLLVWATSSRGRTTGPHCRARRRRGAGLRDPGGREGVRRRVCDARDGDPGGSRRRVHRRQPRRRRQRPRVRDTVGRDFANVRIGESRPDRTSIRVGTSDSVSTCVLARTLPNVPLPTGITSLLQSGLVL